ncbi:hypothetical protein OROGR_026561 [Orobanche gracilis]
MATFSSRRYLFAFFLLNFYFRFMDADPNLLAFNFKNFGKDSNFESQLALFGDAKVANDNMSVQLAGSRVSSAGRLICKKPINLVNSRSMLSFSNYFVFSMSSGSRGDVMAFVMLPSNLPLNFFDGGSIGMLGEKKFRVLAIEIDAFVHTKYDDANRIGVDVETHVSVKVSNVSSAVNLMINSVEKLQAWIEYEASSKKIEVSLGKNGGNKPVAPLLSYPIDLSKMWKDEKITVGLSSSNGNSSRRNIVYSWSFNSRTTPRWMHSEPLDPEDFVEKGEKLKDVKRSECALRILAALILGSGCGAIVAFVVLYVWTILGNRRPVVPEEFALQTKEFEYDKFDKTVEDGKK